MTLFETVFLILAVTVITVSVVYGYLHNKNNR